MNREHCKLIFFVLGVAGTAAVAWYLSANVMLAIYIAFLSVVVISHIFDWPRPEWFSSERIEDVGRKWGNYQIGKAYVPPDKVKSLQTQVHVVNFIVAEQYLDNTKRLCNEVKSPIIVKIIIYCVLIAGLLALNIRLRHSEREFGEDVFKIVAACVLFAGPILWDLSRCEKQRNWNEELREPTDMRG